MNLIVMPYIGAFVREHAWEMTHEEVSGDDWAEHVYNLFFSGCQNMSTTLATPLSKPTFESDK